MLETNEGVFKILKNIKNVFVHIRGSLKVILMVIISAILIISIISIFYKPTYEVTINGEFIGYTSDKNGLQKKINEYMQGKAIENIAFVDVQTLPEYSLCFVKREEAENDEAILEKLKTMGTTYYECYAVVLDNEEKYYVPTKEIAEAIIDKLKEKNSSNIDKLGYTQVYSVEEKEYTEQEEVVTALYKKKVVRSSVGSYPITTAKLDLGITFTKPVVSGYTITSRFGARASGTHSGLDIAAPTGTPIYAAAAGTVTNVVYMTTSYGIHAKIQHANGVETLYAHCSELYVTEGQYVAQGELIGAVGSTGRSTGPHLHLEIRANGQTLNPQHYLY